MIGTEGEGVRGGGTLGQIIENEFECLADRSGL